MTSPVKSSCWPWSHAKQQPQDSPQGKSPPLTQIKATAAFRKEFESYDGPIPKTRPMRYNHELKCMEIAHNGPEGIIWKPFPTE